MKLSMWYHVIARETNARNRYWSWQEDLVVEKGVDEGGRRVCKKKIRRKYPARGRSDMMSVVVLMEWFLMIMSIPAMRPILFRLRHSQPALLGMRRPKSQRY